MVVFNLTDHQKKQIEIINEIENRVRNNSLRSSVVTPTDDYENDSRMCLTGVHLPRIDLKNIIYQTLINPLQKINPNHYYYPPSSLHLTIKNVRVINYPPHFTDQDIEKAKKVFKEIIPKHNKFKVYFYRLLLFPYNLTLMGTTDPELDNIVLDLDKRLTQAGIPDDKQYTNPKYFFSNMTLARFTSPVTQEFREEVTALSKYIKFEPYIVNSVTLLTCNAVLKRSKIIGNWRLR